MRWQCERREWRERCQPAVETEVTLNHKDESMQETTNWACCCRCNKWRRVVSLPGEDEWWECSLNTAGSSSGVLLTSTCDAPEDADDEDAEDWRVGVQKLSDELEWIKALTARFEQGVERERDIRREARTRSRARR